MRDLDSLPAIGPVAGMLCISFGVFPLSVQILVLLIIGRDLFVEWLVSAVFGWLDAAIWLIYVWLGWG